MMVVDGKAIANTVYRAVAKRVAAMKKKPKMGIITCAPNFETQKYLELKKRKADEVGVGLVILELPENATTNDVITTVRRLVLEVDGVVVQLPLPNHIDREAVLDVIPADCDPDCFSKKRHNNILPPVIGAIDEIAKLHSISFADKNVVILGHGRLVGEPAALYAKEKGAAVTVIAKESEHAHEHLKNADIIISGVGKPNLVTKEMVKDGVIVFDAGTSEDGGELRGDISVSVADKAALYTPVPGGIGPITIAVLLHNLVVLSET